MWLEQYPSISLVIDLHRDAAGDSAAGQLKTQVSIDGTSSAQLMIVVGSNAGGRQHPNWKENFALAAKLHTQLEKRFPGICRPISFRTERFNQDLSPGALLIEVGAAGDTLEEALAAAAFLAEGISNLALGTITADSTS
jgi:stage II sporulation protein P